MSRCPVFPKPRKNQRSGVLAFMAKRRSWLDGLYERSYRMKMGEVELPAVHLFMPNQPELVQKILVDEASEFPKHALLDEQLRPLLGDSIFNTNGAVWQRQRDMLDVAFDNRQVERVFEPMQVAAERMLERIDASIAASESGVIDIDPEMTLVTADIIFRTIMSTELDAHEAQDVLEAFERYQARSPRFALLRMFGVPQGALLRFLDRKRARDAEIIRHYIHRAIERRYRQFLRDGEDSTGDILAQILNARDAKGEGFSLEEVVDQVSMLFLAGHETSASAMTWTLYLLALHPEWQGAIRDELSSLGERSDWSIKGLKRCNKLRMVFMEALRLYPPVGFFMRETTKDEVMRDKKLKKGSLVVIAPWLLQRHKDLWNEPEQFCPMRFDSKAEGRLPKYAYLPFGVGPRVCIGAAFAMQEAMLLLATLVKQYAFSLEEGFEPDPVGRLTIRSDNGLRLLISPCKES